jgi:hypothetical protein
MSSGNLDIIRNRPEMRKQSPQFYAEFYSLSCKTSAKFIQMNSPPKVFPKLLKLVFSGCEGEDGELEGENIFGESFIWANP